MSEMTEFSEESIRERGMDVPTIGSVVMVNEVTPENKLSGTRFERAEQ